MSTYTEFLQRKGQANAGSGFPVNFMPASAFPFQQWLFAQAVAP